MYICLIIFVVILSLLKGWPILTSGVRVAHVDILRDMLYSLKNYVVLLLQVHK